MQDPIIVRSFGDEQYVGCTGSPADTHVVNWLTMSRDRPLERCPECGSVYNMDYVGPQEDPHGSHGDHTDHRTFLPPLLPFHCHTNLKQQTPITMVPTTTTASLRPLPISSVLNTDRLFPFLFLL